MLNIVQDVTFHLSHVTFSEGRTKLKDATLASVTYK